MPVTKREKLFFTPEISPSMIFHHLEKFHFQSIFDPLSFTSGGSGYFKLQNIRVVSNDPSMFTYVRGKALWENNSFYIPEKTVDAVCAVDDGELDGHVRFAGLDAPHLNDEMKAYLDLWHIRIHHEKDEYVQALLLTAVTWCIDYWITSRESGVEPFFDPPSLLKYYLNHVNRQVMNNHDSNEMWRERPHELASKVLTDAMFLNPPPMKGYASLGLRECIAERWLRADPQFDMARIVHDGCLGGTFDDREQYIAALRDFLKHARHIQLWIIALSNRHPFTAVELQEILKDYGRKVASVDIELPPGFFSTRAVHTVVVASG